MYGVGLQLPLFLFLIGLKERPFGWTVIFSWSKNSNHLPIVKQLLQSFFLSLFSARRNSSRQSHFTWLSPVLFVIRRQVVPITSSPLDVELLYFSSPLIPGLQSLGTLPLSVLPTIYDLPAFQSGINKLNLVWMFFTRIPSTPHLLIVGLIVFYCRSRCAIKKTELPMNTIHQ